VAQRAVRAIEQGKRPDEVRRQSSHAAKSAIFWEYVRKAQRRHNPSAEASDCDHQPPMQRGPYRTRYGPLLCDLHH
jgi:hypothetical protein